MTSSSLSLWLSVAFLMLFFTLSLLTLIWWQKQCQTQTKEFLSLMASTQAETQKLSESLIDSMNRNMTLLSVKDPISYQQIMAMETTSSPSEAYLPQDDESEAKRHAEMSGYDEELQEWYNEDGST